MAAIGLDLHELDEATAHLIITFQIEELEIAAQADRESGVPGVADLNHARSIQRDELLSRLPAAMAEAHIAASTEDFSGGAAHLVMPPEIVDIHDEDERDNEVQQQAITLVEDLHHTKVTEEETGDGPAQQAASVEATTRTDLESDDDPPELLFECSTCLDDFTLEETWQAPCEHRYCKPCLDLQFRSTLSDESLYPPRCCAPLDFEEVQHQLPAELALQYADKVKEYNDPDKVYCFDPQCGVYIPNDSYLRARNGGSMPHCSSCDRNTCYECKHEMHEGACHENIGDQQALNLARQLGWQTCPGCGRITSLSSGCNHVGDIPYPSDPISC